MMKIDILLCTDKHYVMPCGITIFSICYHNKQHEVYFHVFSEGVTYDRKKRIREMVEAQRQNVIFYDVDSSLLDCVPVVNRFRLSIYYRLLMTRLLPSSLHRVLYLDSDIIVRGDLAEIWSEDIDGFALGAVLDQNCDDIRNYSRNDLEPLSGYFNSGVLLVNLDYWRSHNIGDKCIEYVYKHSTEIEYPDQDALNVVTFRKWKAMPFAFNTQSFMYYKENEIIARLGYVRQMVSASMNPLVMHFTDARKPWMEGCLHPFVNEYLKYKNLSPWQQTPLEKRKNEGRLIKICRRIKHVGVKLGLVSNTQEYSHYRNFQGKKLPEYANSPSVKINNDPTT